MRIVIVEDNESVAKGVAYMLRDAGHAVDIIADGDAADGFLRDDKADVLLLDVTLPGLSGLEVLRRLRRRGDSRPVLLLTARGATSERIEGLDAGADDYLVKPFEMAELEARIRALARRRGAPLVTAVAVGPLAFHPETREIRGPHRALELPRRELAMFEAMALSQGRVLSKSQLLDAAYGVGSDVEDKVVEVYMSRLRKRLKPHAIEIRMQRGLGYQLCALDQDPDKDLGQELEKIPDQDPEKDPDQDPGMDADRS